MNIYIDTNILLSFFHLTSEDLGELDKLIVLLNQGKVSLLLPGQTRDEFRRNRATKIADALKRFTEQKLTIQFPAMCKDYKQYDELRKLQKDYGKNHAQLLEDMLKDITDRKLKADTIIEQLFDLATVIETTPELVERARFRMDVRNPPGKDGSLGDAINWEALLEAVPAKEDLYFIGDDKDHRSPLDDNCFNEFLEQEWQAQKQSGLHYYRRLSSFFADRFPDIKLAAELEKELLIEDLATSRSFANTHTVVADLAKFGDFTPAQANDIIRIASSNNQVRWIVEDKDVNSFLRRIVADHRKDIDPDELAEIEGHLKAEEPNASGDGES